MADPNITEEVHFEMLEKKADGTFKAKYPKVKSKSGVTFDEHLADDIHIPSGLISMWSGLISEIPDGWVLCDGNNGTPNLKDRFIMGATTDATINKTGGQNKVTLTVNQMPSHNHGGATNSAGSHTHTVALASSQQPGETARPSLMNNDDYLKSIVTGSSGIHLHTISSQGGGQAHENRPAYYTLAFIMKV